MEEFRFAIFAECLSQRATGSFSVPPSSEIGSRADPARRSISGPPHRTRSAVWSLSAAFVGLLPSDAIPRGEKH